MNLSYTTQQPKHTPADIMIARFMGYDYIGGTFYYGARNTENRGKWFTVCKYSYSYDALLEVYRKFRDLKFENAALQLEHKQILVPVTYHLVNSGIGALYTELVMAIEWYNSIQSS